MPFQVLDPLLAEAAPTTTLGVPLTSQGATLGQMIAELDALALGRGDIDDDRISTWINESYIDLYTSINFDPQSLEIILIAGQPMYLLPTVVEEVMEVALILPETVNPDGGYPLEMISRGYYKKLAIEEGDPRLYFVSNGMLVVYPTPTESRSLALDVRIRPQDLTLPNHSPILAKEWHEAIKQGARAKMHDALHEYDKSQIADNKQISSVRKRKDPEELHDVGRTVGSSAPHKTQVGRNAVSRFRRDYDD